MTNIQHRHKQFVSVYTEDFYLHRRNKSLKKRENVLYYNNNKFLHLLYIILDSIFFQIPEKTVIKTIKQ